MLPIVTRFSPSRHYSVDEGGRHLVSLRYEFRDLSAGKDERMITTSGAMRKGGHMAGAARPGSCAVLHHLHAGNPASIYTRKWLDGVEQPMPVSPVFATDRATPRPLERSP
jgi:hypothetical protein